MRKPSNFRSMTMLLISLALSYVVAGVGSLASIDAKSFYGQLVQPSWAPPGWLFGPVWLFLYTMMAISAWLTWRNGGVKAQRSALSIYLIHFIPNLLWSWIFFFYQQGAAALINIAVLWLFVLVTTYKFFSISRIAGSLLLPYLCWVTFAAALNYQLWQLNPALL